MRKRSPFWSLGAIFPAALFTATVGRRRPAFAAPVQFLVVAGGIIAPIAAVLGWLDAMAADPDPLLHEVQARRAFPTRVIQAGQKLAQDNAIGTVLSGAPIIDAPAIVKLLDRFPLLRRIPGRIIGLGVRRERVRSPTAPH